MFNFLDGTFSYRNLLRGFQLKRRFYHIFMIFPYNCNWNPLFRTNPLFKISDYCVEKILFLVSVPLFISDYCVSDFIPKDAS